MTDAGLLTDWEALLERRPAFRDVLAPYESILRAWVVWTGASGTRPAPLQWTAEDCRERWRRGIPLAAEAPPLLEATAIEPLAEPTLEALAVAGADPAALQRFAEAWDRGDVGPDALFPERGRLGAPSVLERTGLGPEAVGFLAVGCLRPPLEGYFALCRPHLGGRGWDLGVCPCCGAPPAFADLLEDGQRRLACHLCGAGWTFSRLRCPHCGSQRPEDAVRLLAEDREEGYAISACRACRGYVKELDRRLRWNAGPALVEDWGSPHLDWVAHREGYWRGLPLLLRPGASP